MTPSRQVAIIDDDRDFLESLSELLEVEGYAVSAFPDAGIALQQLDRDFSGVVLLDIRMPRVSGEDALKQLQALDDSLPVIHVTGHGDIPMAVRALKQGAYGFFTKPLDLDELLRDVKNAIASRETELERRRLARQIQMRDGLVDTIVGGSPLMVELRQQIARIGPTAVDVLLRGDTGTGKEIVARALAEASSHEQSPFVAVNCGHVSHSQATGELFGVETLLANGETVIRSGHFERAHGGTLLLDEIESMPLDMQARLLRVLEERVLERINGEHSVQLDLRIIATTKVDLAARAEEGRFRQDLYYRLSGVEIRLPPLRERGADAVILFERFLQQLHCEQEVTPGLMSDLLSHDWPGNVRELKNAAERFAANLSVFATDESRASRRNSLAARVADFEKGLIEAALAHHEGSVKRTMLDLDIPRKTLYDKMTKYDIRKERYQSEND